MARRMRDPSFRDQQWQGRFDLSLVLSLVSRVEILESQRVELG